MIDRNNPQIIRNCKKDINLAFIPNQIEESFVSLQMEIGFVNIRYLHRNYTATK